MNLAEIWAVLNDTAKDAPESRRRIAPDSVADVWLVLKGTQKLRTLRIGVEDSQGFLELPSGYGMTVNLIEDLRDKCFLEVSLVNMSYSDVFDVFITDLVTAATSVSYRSEVANVVARRIDHWQAFLRRTHDGLSDEQARGLFGELKVLEWIGEHSNYSLAISCWVGPDGFSQDFHLRDGAIEVKTSAAKNPQSISITSERQLDPKGLNLLALWHWSVDERFEHGESLPDLISKLRAHAAESMHQELFENRLLMAGYLDIHSSKYSYGYEVRSCLIFEVFSSFPRLVEADCPVGLGNVRYSIQLGAIADFEISDETLLLRLNLGKD